MAPRGSLVRVRAEPTSFVGRQPEIAVARALLESSRLVTLIGSGGVGKTRLALQVAREVGTGFPDGVRVAELDAVSDEDLVAGTVAAELGLRDLPGEPMDTVIDYLRDKSLLLVLDNCEHLVGACGMLVGKILAAAPAVRIMATSRHVLGIEGEHLLPIQPFDVPAEGGEAAGSDAVTLLTHRVAAVDRQFTLGPANRDTIAAICRRVDGIPLAIELVAVWFRVLGPDEILRHLTGEFDLLGRPGKARPSRQKTVWATVAWSYDLCWPAEQALWDRLSVFRHGFTLPAAEHVGVAGGVFHRDDVLDLVAGLVDKSILIREDDFTVTVTGTRYRMLETVREYGMRKLAEAGAVDEARDRHRDYYLGLAREWSGAWSGPRQLEVAAATRREHANLRAALEHGLGAADPLPGAHLAVLLHYFWLYCGYFGEGRRWMDRVLALADLPPAIRGEALWINCYAVCALGDPRTGEGHAAEAIQNAASGDAYQRGTALLAEGGPAFVLHDLARADACYTESIQLLTSADRIDGRLILAYGAQAMVAAFMGDLPRTRELARESIRIADSHGEQWDRSFAVYALALAEWQTGNHEQAVLHAIDSMRTKHRFNDTVGLAMNVELLAWIASSAGDGGKAARLLGAAGQVWRYVGGKAMLGSENWSAPHNVCVEQAQAQLGEHRFAAAVAEGAASSPDVDTAVDYVLGEVRDTPARRRDAATGLTKRETQIARLVASGASNKQIAAELVISRRTVDTHVRNILEKLGFTSRIQVATWLARQTQIT